MTNNTRRPGRPIRYTSPRATLQIRIDAETKRRVLASADTTVSAWVEQAIRDRLDRDQ